jgi:hypothetical protein
MVLAIAAMFFGQRVFDHLEKYQLYKPAPPEPLPDERYHKPTVECLLSDLTPVYAVVEIRYPSKDEKTTTQAIIEHQIQRALNILFRKETAASSSAAEVYQRADVVLDENAALLRDELRLTMLKLKVIDISPR